MFSFPLAKNEAKVEHTPALTYCIFSFVSTVYQFQVFEE